MSTTVHVNSLRWFAEQDGGAEFVRSHGDHLADETIVRAQALAYPDAIRVVTTLREAGVGADCWFTLSAPDTAQGLLEPGSGTASLGGLSLSVGGERELISSHAAVTGLTCTGPDDEAIARAAAAMARAFGPQVVWDDGLADVMLVDSDTPIETIRARWQTN
ncbi:hypothetical protein [Yinghuangia sp. YIM S09857]|uniref:hypothetical protein n=1 Tax=Yinghuangia sp. YIM S09857 TaxID=3436929 RepID=UPI003F530047